MIERRTMGKRLNLAFTWIEKIRNQHNQRYAKAYWDHLWLDAPVPRETAYGISTIAALNVRLELDHIYREGAS